jgi:hypothetical protein
MGPDPAYIGLAGFGSGTPGILDAFGSPTKKIYFPGPSIYLLPPPLPLYIPIPIPPNPTITRVPSSPTLFPVGVYLPPHRVYREVRTRGLFRAGLFRAGLFRAGLFFQPRFAPRTSTPEVGVAAVRMDGLSHFFFFLSRDRRSA